MVCITYYFSMKYNASIFSVFLRAPVFEVSPNAKRGAPAPPTAPGQGANHPEMRWSETIAKPRVEFGQRVRSVLLILNGKILPVAAYLAAAHLERFGIAHITRVQDVRVKRASRLQLLHVLES